MLFVLAVLLALVSAPLPAAAGAALDGGPRFEPAPCPVEIPYGMTVECGYLVVPENRSQPEGREVRLAVALLKSHGDDPASDPVVYLEGGPGGSALESIDRWLDSPVLDRRDLILFEQRGTRYAEPWLDCPELKDTYIESWILGLDEDQEIAREVEAAVECRDRLLAEGIDLTAYNSAASAADLADLRRALGYDEWNLYGISYGTRLALTAMRDHPQGIRSVILDSVYPPVLDAYVELIPYTARVVDKLLGDCAADPACQAAYPTLEADLYQLLEQVDEQPIEIAARHPDTGERLYLPLDGDWIVTELFMAFYDAAMIPFLPLIINQVHQGNHDVLLSLTDYTLSAFLSGSEGMNKSVQCYEEAPFNSPEAITAKAQTVPPPLHAFSLTGTLEVCALWGAGIADPIEDEPVQSDIPTLVMEGEYDPITPPAAGRLAAETLAHSFYYEFPGQGHGVTLEGCPRDVAVAFLDDPTVEPDAACREEMRGPEFYTTGDLYLTPAAYRLLDGLAAEGSRLPFVLLGFLDLFFLLLVFVCVWALLRALRVWPGSHPRGEWLFHGLLAIIALMNIFFLAGLAGLIVGALVGDWSILLFGLPKAASVWLLVPLLISLLTAGAVLYLAVAWMKRYWSAVQRVLYSLIALGLLAFLWFLAYWDLLGIHL